VGFFGWVFCCQLCLIEEDEDLLVGEAVERAGEAAHAGREGNVGVGQGRAHQVGGVGRHVPALVVAEVRGKNTKLGTDKSLPVPTVRYLTALGGMVPTKKGDNTEFSSVIYLPKYLNFDLNKRNLVFKSSCTRNLDPDSPTNL
jgi:hypothetical protein